MSTRIRNWFTNASNNNAAPPFGAPENHAPSATNNIQRQVMAEVKGQRNDYPWIQTRDPSRTGATTFTCAGDDTELNMFKVGRRIRATDTSTLTGYVSTATLSGSNVNVTVVLDSGSLTAALSEMYVSVLGGNEDQTLPQSVGVLRGYINGFTLSNSAGDTAHDVDVASGQAADKDATQYIRTTSTLTKQADATWTAGSAVGGMASGVAFVSGTTYHVFVIAKPDGTADAGFDNTITAANLLATASGYTKYRRVGSVMTDGSTSIRQFTQNDNFFQWKVPLQDLVITSLPTTASLYALTVPSGVKQISKAYYWFRRTGTGETVGLITSPEQDDTTPSGTVYNMRSNQDSNNYIDSQPYQGLMLTDTSGRIRLRFNSTDDDLENLTMGWFDFRGEEE